MEALYFIFISFDRTTFISGAVAQLFTALMLDVMPNFYQRNLFAF